LIFYLISFPLAIFEYVMLIRRGYTWSETAWLSLLIFHALRVAAFISELVFVGSGYTNFNAVIASIICTSAGSFGLIEASFRSLEIWARVHLQLAPHIHGYMQQVSKITRVGLILCIVGGAVSSSAYETGSAISPTSTGQQLLQAGQCLFLAITVLLTICVVVSVFAAGFDVIIGCLLGLIPFLLTRMSFAVVGAFLWQWSLANYGISILRLALSLLLMEGVVVCLLHAIGMRMIRENKARISPNPVGSDLLGLNAIRHMRQSFSEGQTSGKSPITRARGENYLA